VRRPGSPGTPIVSEEAWPGSRRADGSSARASTTPESGAVYPRGYFRPLDSLLTFVAAVLLAARREGPILVVSAFAVLAAAMLSARHEELGCHVYRASCTVTCLDNTIQPYTAVGYCAVSLDRGGPVYEPIALCQGSAEAKALCGLGAIDPNVACTCTGWQQNEGCECQGWSGPW